VHELTLEVRPGEVCVLVGPSGCGKTTTMRMVNRLVEPSSGRIHVGGQDVTDVDPVQLRRQIGYVIQQVGLFPHLTVRRNVATVPELLGWSRARTTERVDELLGLVGLDPAVHGDRYPHQLSGGQRQRVGVARALAADPPVLLMDEPFGAVDPIARDRLQDEFLRLQEAVRKTVVFVTHDVDEAVRLGDRIAVMREGGWLEQYAAPEQLLAEPASDFVASFVGSDRTIKRLAVTSIGLGTLEPVGVEDVASPEVAAGATLRDSLAVLLESSTGRARVVRGGETLGVLTLAAVHAELRAPRSDPDADEEPESEDLARA
jgi:osmoprotectant transport system ATP-binding protein